MRAWLVTNANESVSICKQGKVSWSEIDDAFGRTVTRPDTTIVYGGDVEEMLYPIYRFYARVYYDGCYEGIPTMLISRKMYRDEPTYEELASDLQTWYNNALTQKRYNGKKPSIVECNPKLLKLEVCLAEHEAWCLDWFSHYTFYHGEDDSAVKQSFERYVQRQLRTSKESLMGADDHWRWKGPCHCEHCEKRGITRIDH